MDQLKAIRYFQSVAELGSFTKAAKKFSVPPSSLSRRVSDLEESLGAALFKRTTRSVQLTEIGREYLKQTQQIVQQLEEVNESVKSYQTKPMGKLKISSMVGFGEAVLLPLMAEFNQLYPDIVLDISLSDELSTLGRDDVDIAIRGGYAPNERVLAIPLLNNQFVPVASPGYLRDHGTPSSPQDLTSHQALVYRTPMGPQSWYYQQDDQWQIAKYIEKAVSNNGPWLGRKAAGGEGIMMAPRWSVKPYLDSGELIELDIKPELSISQGMKLAVYLLYQKQRYLVPKVKVAVDFLVSRIKD